ncbi:R-specific enoyl-CoA hydratase [Nymphaea thermarum]|nr:R-specific enoyl-CoA hydratase [Nymphaea thermarum]
MTLRKTLAPKSRSLLSFFSSSSSSPPPPPPPIRRIEAGDVLRRWRVFTPADVDAYSKVSHDTNPVHFDADLARLFGFRDRVVHGMLVASLFPNVIASHFVRSLFSVSLISLTPGAVYVSQTLQFRSPVFVGEKVVAEVQTLHLRENRKRHLAKFQTKCLKDGDHVVIDGEAMAILPSLEMREVQQEEP